MKVNNSEKIYQSGLAVYPNYSIGFTLRIDGNQMQSDMPKINMSEGILSYKAQCRIKKAIHWLIFLSENKYYYSKQTKRMHKLQINFITLTLSSKQMHSDEFIQRHMMQPFIKWMNRNGNTLYVWKAETQANGNIHFHITGNKYINWRSIRNKWNSIQDAHGYIREYIQSGGDADPNSTDVKGIKNIKNIPAYMAKYLTKNNEERRKVTCKIWACSAELNKIKTCIRDGDEYFTEIANRITMNSDKIDLEKCTLFLHNNKPVTNPIIEYLIKKNECEND